MRDIEFYGTREPCKCTHNRVSKYKGKYKCTKCKHYRKGFILYVWSTEKDKNGNDYKTLKEVFIK